jgi:hypothetical protein
MATTTNQRSSQQEDFGAKVQEKATDATRQFMDKAREAGSNVADKAKEFGSNVADKAKEYGSNIAEKAKEAGNQAGQRADDATQCVGKRMESLAGSIRENLPTSGVIGAAGSTFASGLESTGRYLEQEGLSGMANDVAGMIRKNPLPALLLGICAGFLIARAVDRNS